FASRDCEILATDLAADLSDKGWMSTGQHADSLNAIFRPELLDRAKFDSLVKFQPADMRTLSGLSGAYDFIWSSCAFEHLGTLEAGLNFVVNSSRLLNEDGIAVHTTEFNVSSNDATITKGPSVIYRKRDLIRLSKELARNGFTLEKLNFDAGHHK